VEELAVKPVLREGPEAKAGQPQQQQLAGALPVAGAQHHHCHDDRDEDERGHHGMDPREEVEEPVLEEGWRGAQPRGSFLRHGGAILARAPPQTDLRGRLSEAFPQTAEIGP
jgi:hypothetical protein